jgi:hypothetical protein
MPLEAPQSLADILTGRVWARDSILEYMLDVLIDADEGFLELLRVVHPLPPQ